MTELEHPFTLYAALRAREPGAHALAGRRLAPPRPRSCDGVRLRGAYPLAGFRAEADLLLWLVGPSADALQDALVAFRHSELGRALTPCGRRGRAPRRGVQQGARPRVPPGEEPRKYVCVYPFVRSLDWYLLAPDERSELLREHGMMGRDYPDVRANTVSASRSATTSGCWPSRPTS